MGIIIKGFTTVIAKWPGAMDFVDSVLVDMD